MADKLLKTYRAVMEEYGGAGGFVNINDYFDQNEKLIASKADLKETTDRYQELLMAVERKHPGEARHQTALRYIQEAERSNNGPTSGKQQSNVAKKV